MLKLLLLSYLFNIRCFAERMSGEEGGTDNSEDEGDDVTEFHAGRGAEDENRNNQPRWPTRVFAAESLRRIITACRTSNKPQHFDLALAKEMQQTSNTGIIFFYFVSVERDRL